MIDYSECKTLEELGNPPKKWSDEYYERMRELLEEEGKDNGENGLDN